jgi:hypothetical protein
VAFLLQVPDDRDRAGVLRDRELTSGDLEGRDASTSHAWTLTRCDTCRDS